MYTKKQIEKMNSYIQSINKTHQKLKAYIEKYDYIRYKKKMEKQKSDTVMELIARCQNNATQLKSIIEEKEGEEFVTVKLTEAYCKLLYWLYEEIKHSTEDTKEKLINIYNQLETARLKVSDSMEKDMCLLSP